MRAPRLGFALIESLAGLAVVALLAATVIAGVGWGLGRTAERTERAWLVELARSVGEEYRVTGDPGLRAGSAPADYRWRIETRRAPEPGVAGLSVDRFMVTVWYGARPGRTHSLDFAAGPAP